jgi:Uma2 family endonuclease
MSAALAFVPPRTLQEFLDWVPQQDGAFEWDGVQPVAMVGGTAEHSELASRVAEALRTKLRGGQCRVFRSDVGVRTKGGTRIRYPDIAVTCSHVPRGSLIIPDPVLIVEVLSETTAAIDRGVKRAEYAALPSLSRYVMLAQDAPIALVCARDEGFEERRETRSLELPEFGVSLALGDLYAGLLD